MDSFDCDGWLYIWASEDSDCVFVRIRHKVQHVHYCCIDVPDDVRKYVIDNPQLRVPQLWGEILKTHPSPDFTQKSIYNLWAQQSEHQWKRDADEVKSARILLEEFQNKPVNSAYSIESIPMPEAQDGFTALAFSLPNTLRKWGGTIREVALDSAWNTNKSRFEVYALLGEVYGSGCPLGYLLIQSNNGEEGAKEKYIRKLLEHFRVKWEMCLLETLSDKDITEINAFLAELPVKHQLCFWHCLRAIKVRLATIARHPAPYNPDEAFKEFDWIDRKFVPVNQMDPRDVVRSH
ncbi:hypothetical protein BDZ89DRAFT_1188004 [Hymenopellis radicata]|nr:hypothetical protein BDZ89DRAFT_1188004 [Hymenopellis radicata]